MLAYQRKRLSDHEVHRPGRARPADTAFSTQALWYELPEEIARHDFPLEALLGALHAAEHSQIAVLPLLAMCDRWDIGGLSTNLHPQTGRPDDLHLRRPPGRRSGSRGAATCLRRAGRRRATG